MISHVMGNLRFKGSDITMTEEMLMRLYRYSIYILYIYTYNRVCCIPINDFKPPPLFFGRFFVVAGCFFEWLEEVSCEVWSRFHVFCWAGNPMFSGSNFRKPLGCMLV